MLYELRRSRWDNLSDDDSPGGSPTTFSDADRYSVGNQSEQAQRSRRIEARRAQADLLLSAPTQDTLTIQIRLALRELDEASSLNATGRLGSESSGGIVDALLILAGRRLDCVRTLIR
jgi:hypothetical protein